MKSKFVKVDKKRFFDILSRQEEDIHYAVVSNYIRAEKPGDPQGFKDEFFFANSPVRKLFGKSFGDNFWINKEFIDS